MKCLIFVGAVLLAICESKVAYKESDVQISNVDPAKDEPVKFSCTFRTLNGGDPYPSVVISWRDQFHALTWDAEKKEVFKENYKQPAASSHSYPGSSGLSGGESTATQNPFGDVAVVPVNFTQDDILAAFRKNCVRPY